MDLNKRQEEAVIHENGPLLIIAGAGSGKTKTLTSRVINLIKNGVPGSSILAITFTNKAAKEMRDRILNLGMHLNAADSPFIGTFHSFGARILKEECGYLDRNKNFSILDDEDSLSLIKKIIKQYNLSKEKFKAAKIQYQISETKSELLNPEDALDAVEAQIFKEYEALLKKNNAFDFDDLIEKPVRIFRQHEDVLLKHESRFKHILVDEYQDINTSQYHLIKLLAKTHRNLSVVGDDAQSIYAFRGADYRNFLNFDKDWPGAKIVKLEQNYRSSGNIIRGASEVIKNNKNQKPKTLWTENQDGEPIRIISSKFQNEEADFIASTIKDAIIKKRFKSLAVLYRTNAQSRAIEQALIRADIPYKIFGGLKFYERKEIKDIISGLRLASNPSDSLSLERIKKTFNKATAEKLALGLMEKGKDKTNILDLINFYLKEGSYFESLKAEFLNFTERIENINELIIYAGEFSSLSDFLEQVSLLQATDSSNKNLPQKNSKFLAPEMTANLMTIHMAKGLEFDCVFIAGVSEGILPHERSYASESELEEERRLMYVGMTRAKKELYLTFTSIPSRFIYEIPGNLTQFFHLGSGANSRKELGDDEDYWIEYD